MEAELPTMPCWVSPGPSEVTSLGIICQIRAETLQAKHPGVGVMPTLGPVPSGVPLPISAPGEQNQMFDSPSAPTPEIDGRATSRRPFAILT